MKTHSDAEILAFANQLFGTDKGITVEENTPQSVKIRVADMYEFCSLTFAHLIKLAEFFGTKNINDDDRYSEGGCESFDYGSVYAFTLTVRPEATKQEDFNG